MVLIVVSLKMSRRKDQVCGYLETVSRNEDVIRILAYIV